jgi:Tfp pilus assembly protein PilN
MKRINLIPLTVRKRQRQRQLGGAALLGIIVGGAPLGLLLSAVLVIEKVYADQEADLLFRTEVEQSEGLTPVFAVSGSAGSAKSLADQESELAKATVAQRLSLINDLAVKEVNWVAVYPLINRFSPEGIRLTSVAASRGATTITLKISAVAQDNQSYSAYVDDLKQESLDVVRSVTFDSYAYDTVSRQVTFSITAIVPAPMSVPTPVTTPLASPGASSAIRP